MSLPITFCDECYPASYPECDDLTFPVGLVASGSYIAIISNSKNQKYSIAVTADSGGAITIPYDDFPEGFFNPYAGFYTLEVTNTAGVEQTMTVAYSEYSCISFDIYQFESL